MFYEVNSEFPYLLDLEKNWSVIKSEIQALGETEFTDYEHSKDGGWKIMLFVMLDRINEKFAEVCPETIRLLRNIPNLTFDILSAIYYMRTLNIEVGKTVTVSLLDNDKLYPLDLEIQGRERIAVKAGTFDCLIVEPKLQGGGLFKYEGRILLWVTDDHRKIPVLMKSKAIIGSIIVELESVEGLTK